jgi:hypothetical protein
MYTEEKTRLNLVVSTNTDEKLRNLVFKHRKIANISSLTEAMILHCLRDKKFLSSLKKEIDF